MHDPDPMKEFVRPGDYVLLSGRRTPFEFWIIRVSELDFGTGVKYDRLYQPQDGEWQDREGQTYIFKIRAQAKQESHIVAILKTFQDADHAAQVLQSAYDKERAVIEQATDRMAVMVKLFQNRPV